MKKILVINVNWLGDVIFSSPIFKALKEAYPGAHISCLAVPRVKEVLESIPYIDEIIAYDEKGRHWSLTGKLNLIWGLRRRKFDIAFLLHRSWTRALLVYLARIPQRVGYDAKGRGRFLTHKIEPIEILTHRSDYYLNIIESYGVEVKDRQSNLVISPEAEHDIQKILKSKNISEHDPFIVINPGGNWDLKRWPIENFSRLISGFIASFDARVVIAGAQKDIALVRRISSLAFHKTIDLTGETNLKQLMALMKRAKLVISADSGPLHVANSVGTPVIGLFGPTRPEITGPKGPGRVYILQHDVGCNREACYHLTCPDNICMQSITVGEVLEIVRQIENQ